MEPTDKLRAWKKEAAYDRVQGCRVMLYLHDFLTEAENARVKQRIVKWGLGRKARAVRGLQKREVVG